MPRKSEFKICTICRKKFPKTREYFYYLNKKENILTTRCILCEKIRNKKYEKEKHEKRKTKDKKYRINNKEKIKKRGKEYNKKNKEKIKKRKKEYNKKNKEKIAVYNKEYREKNKDQLTTYNKEYRKNNKEKVNKWSKNYCEKNKEKVQNRRKNYYEKNKETINEKKKEYNKKNKEKGRERQKEYNEQPAKFRRLIVRLRYAEKDLITGGYRTRRCPEDEALLEVRCKKCDKWFKPTNLQAQIRIQCIDKNKGGHFYCSENCKSTCSIYRKIKFPEGHKKQSVREVDQYIKELCLERDDYECQKCGEVENLEVHHIKGAVKDPLLANDIDNVITVCETCHAQIHSEEGCSYADYKRPKCGPE